MKGSSYIPLPDFIFKKKAIKNIQNKDEKCFLWCVLRYLHPKNLNDTRLTDLKQYENELNFKGIDFPVKLSKTKRVLQSFKIKIHQFQELMYFESMITKNFTH